MEQSGLIGLELWGVPGAIWSFALLFVWIVGLFVLLKRPIYEVMFTAFFFTVMLTMSWGKTGTFLLYPSKSDLFYIIAAFLALGFFFSEAKVIDRVIEIILAAVGRFRGGAGYVSLFASTFMAALSGTGPGNVVATGIFTIPTMIRTGFPRPLAATVEMSASSLGNIIPPSGIVVLSFGIFNEQLPGRISLGSFLIAAYVIGFWYLLQRWLVLLGFCTLYRVAPMEPEERPRLGRALRQHWDALLIPAVILAPIALDLLLDRAAPTWYAARLGEEGRQAFGRMALLFSPGLAALYAIWCTRRAEESMLSVGRLLEVFSRSLQTVVPISATIYFSYAIAVVFRDANIASSIQQWVVGLDLSRVGVVVGLPLFFMILGMILPGSSQIAILGGAMLSSYAALGGDALVLAALLPAMTGAMEGMTPPLALAMFGAMGIAKSGFLETSLLAFLWIFFHLVLTMVLLAGWLPIPGLGAGV